MFIKNIVNWDVDLPLVSPAINSKPKLSADQVHYILEILDSKIANYNTKMLIRKYEHTRKYEQ